MRRTFLSGVVLSMVLAACETVSPGEVAVKIDTGHVEGVYPPGFYYDGPMMEFHKLSTRAQSFDMIGTPTQGQAHERSGEGTVTVLTRDQLSVNLDCTVQFHLNGDQALAVFIKFGENYAQTVVHTPARAAIRDSAGRFNALDLSNRREELQTTLESEIRNKIHFLLRQQRVSTNAIILDSVLIRNIDLPNTLDESIVALQRERMQTQQRQQAALTAAQDAARQMAEIRGQSERNLLVARTAADTRRIESESIAAANRTIAASLTPELLRLRAIEAQRDVISSNQTRTVFMPPNMSLFNLGNIPQ